MGTVYRSRHGRSYWRVRVLARENRILNAEILRRTGAQSVVLALGSLAVLDGLTFILIGLR